jgi:hypothetical protein
VLEATAWFLSQCPDPRFRDGPRAVALATRACELDGWKEPILFESLAAAYAEDGNFDKAVEWQQKALDQSQPEDLIKVQERLAQFRRHEPCRFTADSRLK